jgi:hypothetical protein
MERFVTGDVGMAITVIISAIRQWMVRGPYKVKFVFTYR